MALIPVVLEFSGVTKDSSLSLTLTTRGAAWSIGSDDEANEGFSYNALALGETRQSCLTSIELTETVVSIRTSVNAAATSFSLTLFLDVQPNVESVQGHCTLNAGASVACQLGYDVAAEWRSGTFSAIVRAVPSDIRRIRFSIQRAPIGLPITIELMTERSEGVAHWCFDSGVVDAPGLILQAATGIPLPLQSFVINDRQLVVTPGGPSGKVASEIFIEAYLRRMILASSAQASTDSPPKKLKRFHLRATCDASSAVVAQVHVQLPQYLAASYSCFNF